ncbi:restriction endonuclease subunit S [Cutibacterium sp. V947]|uniref:restriction endonuclease subunit S n=1 Tax=Cutibacterium sp. V947 TaxID=3446480 RepID=UPI003EE0118E
MERVSLADLATPGGIVGGPFGSSLVGSDYVSSGVPVIRGSNMGDRFVRGPYTYVTAEKVERDLSRNVARPGDLVLTQRGTLGQTSLAAGPFDTYVISQSQMRVRLDPEKAEARFVYYAAQTSDFMSQIDHSAVRTGVPHINLGILGTLEVPLPPLPEQQAIADVLGALDDKIAANRALVSTMEELLRAQYQHEILDAEAPDTPISKILDVNPKRKITKSKAPQITMQDLPSPGIAIPKATYAEPNGGVRFTNGDTLLARITPCLENGKTGYVSNLTDGEVGFGSTEYIVLRSKEGFPLPLSYFVATEKAFRAEAIQRMVGSSGRQRLKANDLTDFAINITQDTAALAAFGDAAIAGIEHATSLINESATLAALRDTLLPALMDGTLRVKDAEKAAEDAL